MKLPPPPPKVWGIDPVVFQQRNDEAKEWGQHRCWACGCEGLHLQEIYFRLMIGIEKAQLLNLNFGEILLNPAKMRTVAGLEHIATLMRFPTKGKHYQFAKTMPNHLKQVVDMLGEIQLCPTCAKQHGIDMQAEIKARTTAVPELTPEQMANWAAVYQCGVKDEVQAIAKQELENEKH